MTNIFTYYSQKDVNDILEYVKNNKVTRVAVIGTGINALECASSLNALGIKVAIIGRGRNILSKLLEPEESDILKSIIDNSTNNGVSFYSIPTPLKLGTNGGVRNQKATTIQLKEGKEIKVDMIIHSIGTIPNTEFLHNSGVKLGHGGYIELNEYLQTNIPYIYSAGDVALIYNKVWEKYAPNIKWKDAFNQGKCAAKNMLEEESCKYDGISPVVVTKIFKNRLAAAEKNHKSSLTEKHAYNTNSLL